MAETPTQLLKLKCDDCGAPLELPPEAEAAACSYCGAKFAIERQASGTSARVVEHGRPPAAATSTADEFARQAEEAPPGLFAEFWDFLVHNKKWWLTPIILVLLLATALIVLSGTAVGPFIYPGL